MTNEKIGRELIITRIFDAPPERVWKAWTDPAEAKKWWGPKDFTAPTVKIDFRVGGKYLNCMRGVAAPGEPVRDFWSTGTYKEIEPMKKIVLTDSFADEHGNVVSAEHYGMKGLPMELQVTVTFEETRDGNTKMTLRHVGLSEGTIQEMTDTGWNQSFDKLAASITN